MSTVVNNPPPTQESGGNSFLIGIIILVGFVAILLYFGLPYLRQSDQVEVNVPAPEVNIPQPDINIPDEIDVNVNQTE
ncbi:MAG TPA: hypothetical protein PKX78_03285 [Candidatus Woesebacteria bacterium]|jgi:hypothetical protein|nr:hypothetical protein [Candidatus Woesebacteria bacterium]